MTKLSTMLTSCMYSRICMYVRVYACTYISDRQFMFLGGSCRYNPLHSGLLS